MVFVAPEDRKKNRLSAFSRQYFCVIFAGFQGRPIYIFIIFVALGRVRDLIGP